MDGSVILLLAGTALGALTSFTGGWLLQRRQELKRVRYDLYLLITKERAHNGLLPTHVAEYVARAAIVLPRAERGAATRILTCHENLRIYREHARNLDTGSSASDDVEGAKAAYEHESAKAAMETWTFVDSLQKKLGLKDSRQPPLAS
ncbi:MAG: hypothetical protein M3285_02800 [Actinomycetota bacterium]|nr:hypothetical protein [Actinomycetota bacterium]MDQ3954460.1 hypothetical protein [Actinomycetota bacterium]